MVAGVFEMLARGIFGVCLVPYFGFDAVCFANPAAWIMADLFLFPAYFSCIKKQGCVLQRHPRMRIARVKA